MGSVALAQNYPSKTIKLIIPFGAGGGSVTGSRRVLNAKPDGYEVLVNHTTLLTAIPNNKADFIW